MKLNFDKDCKKDFANNDFNASDFCDSDGDDSDFNMSRLVFN